MNKQNKFININKGEGNKKSRKIYMLILHSKSFHKYILDMDSFNSLSQHYMMKICHYKKTLLTNQVQHIQKGKICHYKNTVNESSSTHPERSYIYVNIYIYMYLICVLQKYAFVYGIIVYYLQMYIYIYIYISIIGYIYIYNRVYIYL